MAFAGVLSRPLPSHFHLTLVLVPAALPSLQSKAELFPPSPLLPSLVRARQVSGSSIPSPLAHSSLQLLSFPYSLYIPFRIVISLCLFLRFVYLSPLSCFPPLHTLPSLSFFPAVLSPPLLSPILLLSFPPRALHSFPSILSHFRVFLFFTFARASSHYASFPHTHFHFLHSLC